LNVDQAGNAWPPTAGTFGNPNASIPGWSIVNSPQPGDIVAQQRVYGNWGQKRFFTIKVK